MNVSHEGMSHKDKKLTKAKHSGVFCDFLMNDEVKGVFMLGRSSEGTESVSSTREEEVSGGIAIGQLRCVYSIVGGCKENLCEGKLILVLLCVGACQVFRCYTVCI